LRIDENWHVFFPAAAFANIRNTFGRCLPWLICHPWFLAFDCLDLLQPERRTSSDARESTGNNWKLRFRSHCGFALALHWLCIGFALGLHVFFRSDLLCNLQSLHRLLPKEAATSATIEIKTIETGDIVESKMRVLRVWCVCFFDIFGIGERLGTGTTGWEHLQLKTR
jgi:hypothetical protein